MVAKSKCQHSPRSLWCHVKIRFAIAFVVLVAILIGTYETTSPKTVVSEKITQKAPPLGPDAHLLLPNLSSATVVAPDRPHDPMELRNPETKAQIKRLREFTVSTNSQGFRGPEIPKKKQKRRILCLGDSVTFGWGVEEEASYPALLRKTLGFEVKQSPRVTSVQYY